MRVAGVGHVLADPHRLQHGRREQRMPGADPGIDHRDDRRVRDRGQHRRQAAGLRTDHVRHAQQRPREQADPAHAIGASQRHHRADGHVRADQGQTRGVAKRAVDYGAAGGLDRPQRLREATPGIRFVFRAPALHIHPQQLARIPLRDGFPHVGVQDVIRYQRTDVADHAEQPLLVRRFPSRGALTVFSEVIEEFDQVGVGGEGRDRLVSGGREELQTCLPYPLVHTRDATVKDDDHHQIGMNAQHVTATCMPLADSIDVTLDDPGMPHRIRVSSARPSAWWAVARLRAEHGGQPQVAMARLRAQSQLSRIDRHIRTVKPPPRIVQRVSHHHSFGGTPR
jgi:hypothetical protein